jgi:hypothetical protein
MYYYFISINNNMNSITVLGLSALTLYSVGQILSFIGVSKSVYSAYFLFYILMLISVIILPNDYPSV